MLDFASSSDPEDVGGAPSPTDADILDAYSHAVTSVADAVGPAVVRVEVQGAKGRPAGIGSGVIIAPDNATYEMSDTGNASTAIPYKCIF